MTVTLMRADAAALPLAQASVDLIVTSPPYWGLRSYTDDGEHYQGQIGAEPTPAAYVANLIECTREWMRVLKPSGSIWVNLGDAYYSAKGASGRTTVDANSAARTMRRTSLNPLDGTCFGVERKSLIGLPWRYALRCIDDLGLILRAEVIWSKPNGLPESVTDRVRRSHETWFHFTAAPRYFAAIDTIREAVKNPADTRHLRGRRNLHAPGAHGKGNNSNNNPLGKLPGSVREVATQPLRVPAELGIDHFAAFPMEWPRWIISGWSPPGVCTGCGEGRLVRYGTDRRITGEACGCYTDHPGTGESSAGPRHDQWTPPPTRPAVVLDPFGGTGTTALVADVLGRKGISVDMSGDYMRIARWRCADPAQRARAARHRPPVKRARPPGQEPACLF